MADTGKTIALIKALAKVDPADIQESVEDWLDDHPEATTTVQDGSITKAKLDNNLQSTVDDVSDLKSAIDAMDGDNNAVTVSPFQTPYTDSGITVSNYNGKVKIYGTASANRNLLCFNGQEQNAWSAYAFNQTLPAGTYIVRFATENWPSNDQPTIAYTYTTFASGVYFTEEEKLIIAENPIMLGIFIGKDKNYGTSESPALMDVSICEYKEKADKKSMDAIDANMFAYGNLTISSTNVGQYASMDQMPKNRLVTVLTNAISSIADYPYLTSGYVFTCGGGNSNNLLQIVTPCLNQSGTMAIRQKNNNIWGQWKKIPTFGCGDSGTDQATNIYVALTNSKTIILPPGDYIINSTIFMPDGASIKGCGHSTRLIAGESLTGAVIRMRTNNSISDLAILGSTTEFTPDGETDETCGILVSGTGQSDMTQRRNTISGVEICNFAGSGITLKETGVDVESGVLCDNTFIHHCNIGVNIPNVSEFNRFTNLNINFNYIGIYNNGGNNVFCNCSISKNISAGLKMFSTKDPTTGEESAYNNSHGVFSGCEFTHTGIDNAHPGYAIDIEGMTKTEHFVGCIFGYGYTRIKNSYGIQFTSCTYASRTNIYIDQSGNEDAKGAVIFIGCNSQGITEPPLSVTPENASGVHFVNCYNRNGALVTRYP